jgi:hypothetical protein
MGRKDPELTAMIITGSFKRGLKVLNPTHGSGWFIQMLSTPKLTQQRWNPTNGSWWIVQVPSKKGFEVSTHSHGWD